MIDFNILTPYLRRKSTWIGSLIMLVLLLALPASLTFLSAQLTQRKLAREGQLIVAMRNAPAVCYEGAEGLQGFEYDLVRSLANHLGLKLKIQYYSTVTDLLSAVVSGECHLVAAGITRTHTRMKHHLFGPDYYHVQQVLAYKRGTAAPEDISDLSGSELTIMANSSYAERLAELQEEGLQISVVADTVSSTEQLLTMVWEEKLKYTITDDNIAAINRRYLPELEIGISITEEQPLAWPINKRYRGLKPIITEWLDNLVLAGKLTNLTEKYYGYIEIFDYVDTRRFHNRIESRLPLYRQMFEAAGEKFGIPWTLLAAMSYQESHWRRRAKSPTGVRGIMMLTLTTARAMGVESRLNPEQSIRGGAKYLAKLETQVPDSVLAGDRLKFALAAYNVGMGHVKDAQQLARELGVDPNRWSELREILPLLSQKTYYSRLKHGYARGYEPVMYVQRILNYRDILENMILEDDQ